MPDIAKYNPLPVESNDGGALNLTRVTGLGAALVAVLTTFNDSWEKIFGENTPTWAKPAVIMAVIATFAVVAAADILARGYAAGRRGGMIAMPNGLAAAYKPGRDQRVAVAGVRFKATEDGDTEFLIVKRDHSTVWAGADELDFTNVPAE